MGNKIKHVRISYERKKQLMGWVYTAPWLLGLIWFFLIPMGTSLIYAFSDIDIRPGQIVPTFVGLQNFKDAIFLERNFVQNLFQSVWAMIYEAPLVIIFSIFVAMILNQKFAGRIFLRGIFFLPLIVASGVVLGIMRGDYIAQSVLQGSAGTALFQVFSIQDVLLETGLPYDIVSAIFQFINNIFNLVWKSGIQILLFLAGLQTVSGSLYEAASIEGATAWETFWKITFPVLSPVVILITVYTIIDNFTDSSSNTVMLQINNLTRTNLEMSSAMSWMYLALVGMVTAVVLLVARKVSAD